MKRKVFLQNVQDFFVKSEDQGGLVAKWVVVFFALLREDFF